MVSQDLAYLQGMQSECRTVWFNHLDTIEEQIKANSETLAAGARPDFTIVSLNQLESILSHSGQVDGAHFAKAGGLNTPNARETAPSRQRESFGLLFDRLDVKFLKKPILQAAWMDRPEIVCVPIYLNTDLAPYAAQYNIKVIVQKVTYHMDIEKKGLEKFEADQTRLDTFCAENGIKVLDDIRHVLKITDRLYFNSKMTELLARQSDEIRNKFKMPASLDFANMTELGDVD